MAGFGGAIKLTGETEYRNALKRIKQSLKEVSSEMKLVSSEYSKTDKSAEALTAKQKILTEKLEQQKSKLDLVKTSYVNLSSQYQTNKQKHEALVSEYDKEKKALDDIGRELGEDSKEYKEQKKVVDDLEKEVEQSTKAQEANEKAMSDMRIEMNKSQSEINKTEGDLDKLEKELEQTKTAEGEAATGAKKLDDSLEKVDDEARGAKDGIGVFSVAIGNFIANVVMDAVQKLKDLAGETINVGISFDQTMSKVGAVSGTTGKKFKQLKDKAKEMGEKTKFSASEAAEAMNYMGMAGWDADQMMAGLKGVMDLAAASGEDLGTTSDIVTDALTAFGKEAKDSGEFADVLARLSADANTNVGMLGESFKYVAPVAGSMGMSLQDTGVALGLMANSGIKASNAGTALRSVLTRMASPTKQSGTAMDNLGLSLTDSNGKMKSLGEIMGDLRGSFKGLTKEEKAKNAALLAGKTGMSGLLAIVNASDDKYKELTYSMYHCKDAASTMADEMQNNLGGDMEKLKSKFEGVQLELYRKLEPALRNAAQTAKSLLFGVSWMIKHSTEIIAALAGMAAALGAYIAYTTAIKVMEEGWQALTIVQKAAAAAQWALNVAQSASPIGWLAIALVGLVTAFVILWKKSKTFRNFWLGMWKKIKKAAGPVLDDIKKYFTSLKKEWAKTWKSLKPILNAVQKKFISAWKTIKAVWKKAAPFFDLVWKAIKLIFKGVVVYFTTIFKAAFLAIKLIWTGLNKFFRGIVAGIKLIFVDIPNYFRAKFAAAFTAIKEALSGVAAFFTNLWTQIKAPFLEADKWFREKFTAAASAVKSAFAGVKKFFADIGDAIKNAFGNVDKMCKEKFEAAKDAIHEQFDGLVQYFKDIWKGIKKVFSGKTVKNFFGDKFGDGYDAVKDAFKKIKGWFSDKWEAVKGVFTAKKEGVKAFFKSKFEDGYNAIKDVFNNLKKFLAGVWGKIKDTFKSIGSKLGGSVGSAIKGAINTIIGKAEKVLGGAIDLVNGALKPLRSLVKSITEKDIGTVKKIKFPRLAQGGVLKRGQTGYLEGSGAEAVVPLEKNTQWIRRVAAAMKTELGPVGRKTEAAAVEQIDYSTAVDAFKDALSEMQIILDDEKAGKFVEKTVTRFVYG